MSQHYRLPCSCGQSVSVSAFEAGRQVQCACGKALDVPSMRILKQLEPVGERLAGSGETGVNPRMVLLLIGLALLAATIAMAVYVYQARPQARHVLDKKVAKFFGERILAYNTTPITRSEATVLATDPEEILYLSPMQAHEYLDVLGPEIQFGFNFQENYQILKDSHTLRLIVLAVLAGITLVVLAITPFVPTSLGSPNVSVDRPTGGV